MKKTFDEVVLFARTGLNPRTNFKLGQGNNKYITIKNIHNNKLVVDDNTDVVDDEAIALIHKRSQIKKGDILFCSIGRMGDMYIISEEPIGWDINESVFAFTLNTNIIRQKYFYYVFRQPKTLNFLSSNSSGSTFKSIKMNQLKRMIFDVPPLIEQDKIVATLDSISMIIEFRHQELQALDDLVKARFVEMFGDQESNPFRWKQMTIGDCCALKSGTSLLAEVENEGGSIPYVKVGDMNYPGNERYITTSSRFVTEETAGKGLFEVGSIIFPKRGGAIGTNKKRMTKLPICADLNVMGVSSNGELVPEYLLAYFDMIDMGKLSDGSSVPQINNKNIAPLLICVPPMEKQVEFAAFVKQLDKSKLAVQKALDEAQLLFDSLMQQYFG